MEELKQLIDLVSKTPEMALWAMGMYIFFVLAKMASWVSATTYVLKLAIVKWHAYKEKHIEFKTAEFNNKEINNLLNEVVSTDKSQIGDLFRILKNYKYENGSSYIHSSDIEKAIKILKKHKDDEE